MMIMLSQHCWNTAVNDSILVPSVVSFSVPFTELSYTNMPNSIVLVLVQKCIVYTLWESCCEIFDILLLYCLYQFFH